MQLFERIQVESARRHHGDEQPGTIRPGCNAPHDQVVQAVVSGIAEGEADDLLDLRAELREFSVLFG